MRSPPPAAPSAPDLDDDSDSNIGPYREPMRQRIAEILDIAPATVNVKATTTERLGFTGRGEGIAAQAVANVELL